jgi:hypothetical protein
MILLLPLSASSSTKIAEGKKGRRYGPDHEPSIEENAARAILTRRYGIDRRSLNMPR